jgi:hypothetical protein
LYGFHDSPAAQTGLRRSLMVAQMLWVMCPTASAIMCFRTAAWQHIQTSGVAGPSLPCVSSSSPGWQCRAGVSGREGKPLHQTRASMESIFQNQSCAELGFTRKDSALAASSATLQKRSCWQLLSTLAGAERSVQSLGSGAPPLTASFAVCEQRPVSQLRRASSRDICEGA